MSENKFTRLGSELNTEFLILYNIFLGSEHVDDEKQFRRHIQFCMHLLAGRLDNGEQWIDEAIEKAKEDIEKQKINPNDEDYNFILFSKLAEKIINKMKEENMIEKVEVEGLEA